MSARTPLFAQRSISRRSPAYRRRSSYRVSASAARGSSSGRCEQSADDAEQAPAVRDALEFVLAGVLEGKAGARCQVANDRWRPDLGRTGEGTDPAGHVDRAPFHVVTVGLRL